MEIEIGNLKTDTSQAFGTNAFATYRLKAPHLIGMSPHAVYFWNCWLEPGGNPKRPNFFVAEANFCATIIAPTGRVHRGRTRAQQQRLLARSGLRDMGAVRAAIGAKFPPLMVPIPWPRLQAFMTARFSVRVIAWLAYAHMILTPRGGSATDHYILSIPIAVQFQAIPVWMCNPGMFLIMPRVSTAVTAIPAPKTGPVTDFRRERDEAKDAYKRENPRSSRRFEDSFKRESERRRNKYKKKLQKALDDLLDELEDF